MSEPRFEGGHPDLFRFPRFLPICSDLRSCCREYPALLRFVPICSNLFRFVVRTNQNTSGKPLSADPFCRSPSLSKSKDIQGKMPFSSVCWIFQLLFGPSENRETGRNRAKMADVGRLEATPLNPHLSIMCKWTRPFWATDCRRAPKGLSSAQAAPLCSAGIERAGKCLQG